MKVLQHRRSLKLIVQFLTLSSRQTVGVREVGGDG